MDSMNKGFLLSIAILMLTSCSQEVGPTNGEGSNILIPSRTHMATTMATLSSTPTATKTWIPTNTPTIGPPPDLELKNVTIYPETFDKWGQTYSMLGRIRNNTNQVMAFRGKDIVFKFNFEVLEYDMEQLMFELPPFSHVVYTEETTIWKKLEIEKRSMNCILYPGEEGVFNFSTKSNRGIGGYILDERLDEYNGPLGFWYSYESFYHTRSGLRSDLHPKAENINFKKDQAALEFEYDVVNIPQVENQNHYATLYSWLILYDKEGRIINILYKSLNEMEGLHWGGDFHVSSSTVFTIGQGKWYFKPSVEMTQELIDRVDRVDILNEFVEDDICIGKSS